MVDQFEKTKFYFLNKLSNCFLLAFGVCMISFMLCNNDTLTYERIGMIRYLVYFIGLVFIILGTVVLSIGPISSKDCKYCKTRFVPKEDLEVYYDMGYKIFIAYKNQGGSYDYGLDKIRSLDKFRVVYYYKKKDDKKPLMWEFKIF